MTEYKCQEKVTGWKTDNHFWVKEIRTHDVSRICKQEEQKYLKESLMKYENEKPMMPNEKAKLHEWVASGHDPYENEWGYCFENGHQMDFIEAVRFIEELYEQ